jgi:membrane protease YdiL (CAAX protease family)
VYLKGVTDLAWLYTTVFYGAWIVMSLFFLLKFSDLEKMLKPAIRNRWNFLPLIFIIPAFIFIFIPNIHLLKLDGWLAMNIILCIITPWIEEIYWRGLVSGTFNDNPVISFCVSTIGFALSHPLIFGINSKGDSGLLAFAGTLFVGAIWWWCYYKTKSLRGNIITHFLTDVAGMAVYILANKATLIHF